MSGKNLSLRGPDSVKTFNDLRCNSARELHIDEMKTEWVRVCVRPEQSFTRAILEIYMADGGTLGNIYKTLPLKFQ